MIQYRLPGRALARNQAARVGGRRFVEPRGWLTADFFVGRRLFEDLTDDSVRAREETLIWGLGYLFSVLAGTKPVVLYIAGAQYLDPLTLRALREFAQPLQRPL